MSTFDLREGVNSLSGAQLSDGSDSILDQPLGIGEDCLSPRALVALVSGAGTTQDFEHLKGCTVCLRNLRALAEVRLTPPHDVVQRALSLVEGRPPLSKPATSHRKAEPFRAVVGVVEPVESRDESVDITFYLIPAFSRAHLRELQPESIQVEGAIVGGIVELQERVDVDRDGNPDYLRLRLSGGKLSRRVRKALADHDRVVDTVRVRGTFSSSSLPGFDGAVSVEFASGSHGHSAE